METQIEQMTVPPGFMMDAKGRMVPEKLVSDSDKARDELVKEIVAEVQTLRAEMIRLKKKLMGDIEAFVALSADQYGAKLGGQKGNVSLLSFDGAYRVQRQMGEHLAFGEQIVAAKALIDECLTEWTEDSRPEIRALVNDAFQVDKDGEISIGRVLGLRRLKIDDPRWKSAMEAINDSLQVVGTKSYVRVYERDADGKHKQLSLDFAAL